MLCWRTDPVISACLLLTSAEALSELHAARWIVRLLGRLYKTVSTGLLILPELYLSWTSFTRVTLADRLKIPSISKPDACTRTHSIHTIMNNKAILTERTIYWVNYSRGSRVHYVCALITARKKATLLWKEANGVSHHHGNAFTIWAPLPEPDTHTQWLG